MTNPDFRALAKEMLPWLVDLAASHSGISNGLTAYLDDLEERVRTALAQSASELPQGVINPDLKLLCADAADYLTRLSEKLTTSDDLNEADELEYRLRAEAEAGD